MDIVTDIYYKSMSHNFHLYIDVYIYLHRSRSKKNSVNKIYFSYLTCHVVLQLCEIFQHEYLENNSSHSLYCTCKGCCQYLWQKQTHHTAQKYCPPFCPCWNPHYDIIMQMLIHVATHAVWTQNCLYSITWDVRWGATHPVWTGPKKAQAWRERPCRILHRDNTSHLVTKRRWT